MGLNRDEQVKRRANQNEDSYDLPTKAYRTTLANSRMTDFGELVVAMRTSRFNFKPTWGVSELRDDTTTLNGATIGEVNGEFKLSTGTNANGRVELVTKERGNYQAGTQGEIGEGIRIPNLATGEQFTEYGYLDENNGFGWGLDATGPYVVRYDGGTSNKTRQADWSEDKLDGTGPSGITLDLAKGNIFQVDFVWYGYGPIEFYVNVASSANTGDERILVHVINVNEQVSVVDPNQPISVVVDNNGTASNFDVYVGGRQFSVVDGNSVTNVRTTPVLVTGQSISTDAFSALFAIRKKATFNGRDNSINVRLKNIQALTNQNIAIMVDYGGSVTGGTWGSIPNRKDSETAIELNTTFSSATSNNLAVTTSLYAGSQSSPSAIPVQERVTLGDDDVLIVYARRFSVTATAQILVDMEEDW